MKKADLKQFLGLLVEKEEYTKTKEFAQKMNVSTKTILNYVNELNYQLSDLDARIISKPGVGIRLEADLAACRQIKQSLLDTEPPLADAAVRQEEILERLLMKDERLSVRKLADKYYVSPTTVVKDLEQIEKRIARQELVLEKTRKGTVLSGKEQRIRSAKREFVYQKLGPDAIHRPSQVEEALRQYVEDQEIEIARKIIDKACSVFGARLERSYYVSILISYSIFVHRLRQGHDLKRATIRPVATQLHVLQTYPVMEAIAQDLALEDGLEVSPADLRWMNARFAGVYHEIADTDRQAPQIIQEAVLEMTTFLSELLNVDFVQDEALIRSLENHFIPMFSRLKNNIRITNPCLAQIKQEYSAMFTLVSLSLGILERKLGVLVSDHEAGFVLIHFQAALEARNLSKKILVVYDCPLPNAKLIHNHIKIDLPTFDVLEMIAQEDVKAADFEKFDLIVSTCELPADCPRPVCVISSLAGMSDMIRIQEMYQSLIQNSLDLRFHALLSAMQPDMILCHQKAKSREEVLAAANQVLLDHELVESGFLESVFQRENLASTEIGNGIATPHGTAAFVKHSGVVLVTLEEPVLWQKTEVSMVFLIAITFKDGNMTKNILKDLYSVIRSKDLVQDLKNAQTAQEILSLLYRENEIHGA